MEKVLQDTGEKLAMVRSRMGRGETTILIIGIIKVFVFPPSVREDTTCLEC